MKTGLTPFLLVFFAFSAVKFFCGSVLTLREKEGEGEQKRLLNR